MLDSIRNHLDFFQSLRGEGNSLFLIELADLGDIDTVIADPLKVADAMEQLSDLL